MATKLPNHLAFTAILLLVSLAALVFFLVNLGGH